MSVSSKIVGLGHAIPKHCVENAEIENRLGLEPGWIERRTGIQRRYHADPGITLTGLALQASEMALQAAPLDSKKIGLVLLATSTPDQLLPPSAPLVAHCLGLTDVAAFDLAGACTGFLYALSIADAFVRTHSKPALIVAANILSRRINWQERESAVLFADAAGAIVLAPSEDNTQGLRSTAFRTDGSSYGMLGVAAGGSSQPFTADTPIEKTLMYVEDGKELYRKAADLMTETAERALAQAGVSSGEINRFIPHQANQRISLAVAKNLSIPEEKLVSTIRDYGNSSAATIPLSLSISYRERPFAQDEIILLSAVGAGVTAASIVLVN